MEWVETTGRTLEEAKDNALDQLGVDESEAEFEIIEEPKGGIFGWLRSEARVRARVRPQALLVQKDRRNRRNRSRSPQKQRVEETEAAVIRPQEGKNRRKNDGSSTEEGDQVNQGAETISLPEQAELAREFVSGLVEAFDLQALVTTRELDEETIEVVVAGEHLGLLIGPRGRTLHSIQELTKTVIQRQITGRYARLIVDVSGYRKKRQEALERFVQEIAKDVLASGERRVLDPMTPADRKIVHDAVNQLAGVITMSEGEEPYRRVVIAPQRSHGRALGEAASVRIVGEGSAS
jgi:spoIIIJ-associated protein